MAYDKKEFMEYLRTNTSLMEGSISVYARVIQAYFKEHEAMSLKNIKEFVMTHNREANCVHVKAPFMHYFKWKGIDSKNYEKLPKLREMPKKRKGVYLPENLVKKLIASIDKKPHKDLSVIRFYTGIRAFEALTIKAENIRKRMFRYKKDGQSLKTEVIEITVTAKGGKERKVYLRYPVAKKILRPYLKEGAGFLFIPKDLGGIESDNQALFWTKLQNHRRYYYASLQKAATRIGLHKRYGTHDLRRFFADWASSNHDDRTVQKMMGHARFETTMRYLPDKSKEAVAAMLRL